MGAFWDLFILAMGFVGIFFLLCFIIKLWTGCRMSEAAAKIHNFFGNSEQCEKRYIFRNDPGYIADVENNIRQIIGERRFQKLVELSNTAIKVPLLIFVKNSGITIIAISVNYQDECEKAVLENILTNLTARYLEISGFDTRMITEWRFRRDLQMPYLQIGYAETEAERKALNVLLRSRQQKIVESRKPVTDETEEDDLDE